jgi:hypothetical protein
MVVEAKMFHVDFESEGCLASVAACAIRLPHLHHLFRPPVRLFVWIYKRGRFSLEIRTSHATAFTTASWFIELWVAVLVFPILSCGVHCDTGQ